MPFRNYCMPILLLRHALDPPFQPSYAVLQVRVTTATIKGDSNLYNIRGRPRLGYEFKACTAASAWHQRGLAAQSHLNLNSTL